MIAGAGVVLWNPFDSANLREQGFYTVYCILNSVFSFNYLPLPLLRKEGRKEGVPHDH